MKRVAGVAGVVLALAGLAGCDLPTYPDGTQQLSVQAGPAGTGASNTTIAAAPSVRWRWTAADVGQPRVGVPLIKGDLVIVPVAYGNGGLEPGDDTASRVIAFDRLTGEVEWETLVGHDGELHIGASSTRVFALGEDTGLTAINMSTGAVIWDRPVIGYASSMAPVVVDGDVYLALHADTEAALQAYDGQTGNRLWTEYIDMFIGGSVRPFVSGDEVFLPGICRSVHSADRQSGFQNWHHLGGCYGGGQAEGTVRGNRIYVNETDGDLSTGAILDRATGNQLRTFEARFLPVAGASNLLLLGSGSSIENWTVDGATRRWRTELTSTVTTQPVRPHMSALAASGNAFTVVGGPVAPPEDGIAAELIGVSVGTGQVTHRVPLGTFDGLPRSNQGMAAGNHVLAIAYADQVVVVG